MALHSQMSFLVWGLLGKTYSLDQIKVLGWTRATMESLQTIVVEIKAVLNNRPLTYVSSDVTDADPITLSHLLHGRPTLAPSRCTG